MDTIGSIGKRDICKYSPLITIRNIKKIPSENSIHFLNIGIRTKTRSEGHFVDKMAEDITVLTQHRLSSQYIDRKMRQEWRKFTMIL